MGLGSTEEIAAKFKQNVQGFVEGRLYFRLIPLENCKTAWETRVGLRKSLVEDLEKSFGTLSGSGRLRGLLLKPGDRPYCPDIAISLSHCPLFGGFIFSVGRGLSLGFDVEEAVRIHRAVEYLSGKDEINASPTRALLWVAKEAAFKAVPWQLHGRYLLGDIRIFHWQKRDCGGYDFQFFTRDGFVEGRGRAFLCGRLALGCARSNKKIKADYFSFL